MNSPLPGYGKGLTDDLILGYIGWYTVTQPRLTHEDILDLVIQEGLDLSIVPKPPRPGDAFKRACRYSEVSGIPVPYTSDVANFMFRPVAQTLEEVERHLVVEILDKNGRKLSHHTAAELQFNRSGSKLHVTVHKINEDVDQLVVSVMDDFAGILKDSTVYIEAQVIRRMIRAQLETCHAILARAKGSVYFVPKKHKNTIEGLENFLSHCGPGSGMHTLPLVDDTKQQEFISSAFTDGVHDQANQILSELKSLVTQEKEISANQWNDYKQRLDGLKSKRDEYDTLVDFELSAAETELDAVETYLTEFLLTGLIKEK